MGHDGKTVIVRCSSKWRCDPLMLMTVLLMSITSVLTVLVTAAEVDGTFPRGADVQMIIRHVPTGTTAPELAEEVRRLRPQFIESSVRGDIIHAPFEEASPTPASWHLPLGTHHRLSVGTYPDTATGVMTLAGERRDLEAMLQHLENEGYEIIPVFRGEGGSQSTGGDPLMGPIVFSAFFGAVVSIVLLHLNRRVGAFALEETLGGLAAGARVRGSLCLFGWAVLVTCATGAGALGGLLLFSPGALQATEAVFLLVSTMRIQLLVLVVAIAVGAVISILTAASLVDQLRGVAPQKPIIWVASASLTLFMATVLIVLPLALSAYDQMAASGEIERQWSSVPEVASVNLFALSENELTERSSDVHRIVRDSDDAGVAILNSPDDQCQMVSAGLGGDCVLHLNDRFFALTDQLPEMVSLPQHSGADELVVAMPASRSAEREQIERVAREWADFESVADCEVAGRSCKNHPAPPKVRVVTYPEGQVVDSFAANSSVQSGPAHYRDPVIYYYGLDASWLSDVNTLALVSRGGVAFTEGSERVRQRWEDGGLRDVLADVSSARDTALVAAQRQRQQALMLGSRVLIAGLVAGASVAILSAAECRRRHEHLLATYVLGHRWLRRHRTYISIIVGCLVAGLCIAAGVRGVDRLGDVLLWCAAAAATLLIAAAAAVKHDRAIRGDSLKER